MRVRTKEVEVDGAKFTIGALTIKQVEQITAPYGRDDQNQIKSEEVVARAFLIVCLGLNNAAPSNMTEQPWTRERIENEMDTKSFEFLQDAVLSLSNLVRKTVPGETPATESTSTTSAPAS